MDIKEQIKTLKAQAYDLLSMVEQYRSALNQVNQQIAEFNKKLQLEVEKEKEKVKPEKDSKSK